MRRLLVVLAIAALAAVALTAVAVAADDGPLAVRSPGRGTIGGTTPGVAAPAGPGVSSPGSGSPALGDGTVSSPPLTASPTPAPGGIAGGPLRPIPAAVAARYDPAWGALGTITDLTPTDADADESGSGLLGSFLVVGDPRRSGPDDVGRAFVNVFANARLLRLGDDGALVPCGFAALHEGAVVAVRFSGPVADSYPVQATAGQVVVLAD